MGQSLYDAQHGMSPEELWARYRQYPWRNNAGDMIMQGELAGNWQGPGLPSNIKQERMPEGMLGSTDQVVPFKQKTGSIGVSNLFHRGSQLKTVNHELTHRMQSQADLPFRAIEGNAPGTWYNADLGEGQARMVGRRSAMPQQLQNVVHPYSQMHDDFLDESNLAPVTLSSLLEAYKDNYIAQGKTKEELEKHLAVSTKAIEDHLRPFVPTPQTLQPVRETSAQMQQARTQFGKKVAPTLMELLMQGRERYVPPFISQGMQK